MVTHMNSYNLLFTILSNTSRFFRYATYEKILISISNYLNTKKILTPASTFAGLEQLGSANNEIIETKTPK